MPQRTTADGTHAQCGKLRRSADDPAMATGSILVHMQPPDSEIEPEDRSPRDGPPAAPARAAASTTTPPAASAAALTTPARADEDADLRVARDPLTTGRPAPVRVAPVRLAPVRPILLALFRRFIAERRLRRQFRAVRLAFADRLPPAHLEDRLIFYLNHPSWWDPLLCITLSKRFIPGRRFYAPIEAESLKRYGVLGNFGLFPVEIGTPRGAAQFMRAAEAILREGHVLGLTPQGEFTDARIRPIAFKPGLGALVERLERTGDRVTAVPIALEYTFWDQRLPELLVAVGDPLRTPGAGEADPEGTGAAASTTRVERTAAWTLALEDRLARTQDELAELARARDPRPFETLLQGRRGTAGMYGLWQRLRGAAGGDHLPKSGRSGRGL